MVSSPFIENAGVNSELSLKEQLIIESIKLKGIDVFYIPRDRVENDKIFGETTIAEFEHAFMIEMFVESVEGYQPTSVFMANLGLSLSENTTATFAVSRHRFQNVIPSEIENQPKEGSLIYDPASKQMFEIKSVDAPNPMVDRARSFVFLLQTELYKYSQEGMDDVDVFDVDTNIPEELDKSQPFDENVDEGSRPDGAIGDNWDVSDEFVDLTVEPEK
jgi:hypothetical protein